MVLKFSINYFIFFAAMATVVPYLQQILKMHNFRAYEIGLLLGIFEITGIFGPLIIGWVADRLGKYRIILLILTIGSAISFMFFRIQISFITAALVLVFFGMMYRPIASLTDALASRTLPDLVNQYGRARIWGSIGFVGISFFYQIWGFLDTSSPVRIVSVFIVLMGALLLSNLSLPKIKINRKQKQLPEEREKLLDIIRSMSLPFWIGILSAFIVKMGMSGYYSFFSIYLNDIYGIKGISGIWGIGALAEIPVVLWGSRYVVRYGVAKMLGLAALGTTLRMIIYALAPPVPVMLAAQLLHALSFGLLHITIIVLINQQIKDKSRALAMAIFGGISYGLSGFLGSSISGFILESYGFSVMYYFCGIITFGAVVLIFRFRRVFKV